MSARQFLLDEDRGVSPVIGVILMVAITVILAAVIATFVMNMGPPEETMPNAQFDLEANGSNYDVIHDGGESLEISNLNLTTGNGSAALTSGEASATDVVAYGINSSEEVTITWQNPNSDESQILFEDTAPSS